jgi:putative phage-type endonuclease
MSEWGELSPERIGRATASRMKDITATTRTGGYGASRDNYLYEIVLERLTGMMQPSYENAAMKWGKEKEPDAREAYKWTRDVDVEFAGFVIHPSIPMSGASPDGLVAPDGLVEIKCGEPKTHAANLKIAHNGGEPDQRYVYQMHYQMACTGRAWCDLVSYDPRWKEPKLQLAVIRIQRDQHVIDMLEDEVKRFLEAVDAEVNYFRGLV